MTTKVTITGTGIPIPNPHRAGPGVLVQYTDDAPDSTVNLQFDAGRSTVQRLAGAGLWSPTELDAVFATHHHSDHLTGLPDLLLTRWTMDRYDRCPPLPVVAPNGPCFELVSSLLDNWTHDLQVRAGHTGRTSRPDIDYIGFDATDPPTLVWTSGDVRVLSGLVNHEPVVPAVGYRIETPDGVVAISGDTRVCDGVARLADGADVLVYEVIRAAPILAEGIRPHVIEYHADSFEVGRQAAELQTPVLILTHLLPQPDTDEEVKAFVDDVRAGGYEGELIAADDLDSVTLPLRAT